MKQVPVLLSNGEEKISDGSSTQVLVLEKYLGFYHTTYFIMKKGKNLAGKKEKPN